MKAKLMLSALLVASLSGCASSMVEDGTCYDNLGACLVVGTAETIVYTAGELAFGALVSALDGDNDRHDKKKRGH